MPVKFANNAVGSLSGAITDSDVTLVLSGTEGSRFPSLLAGEYFFATIIDADGNREIVKVTARVDNTLTVVRAQEGTSARSFDAGSKVSHRLTAGALNELVTQIQSITSQLSSIGDDITGLEEVVEQLNGVVEQLEQLDKTNGNFVVTDGTKITGANASTARGLLEVKRTVVVTQAEFDELNPPDSDTVYLIKDVGDS